jgi:hypothetical protein
MAPVLIMTSQTERELVFKGEKEKRNQGSRVLFVSVYLQFYNFRFYEFQVYSYSQMIAGEHSRRKSCELQ